MRGLEDARREILEAVAAGRLSPAEAAERLARPVDPEPHAAPPPPQPSGDSGEPLRRVRLVATGHPVRVVGDPSVREAMADGPHTARREGDTLVITAEDDSYASAVAGSFAFAAAGPGWTRHGHRRRGPQRLDVRMHPDLALAAEVTAGTLAVRGVRGPIAACVSAGSGTIEGFASTIDLEVSAGRMTARGVVDRGESRVRCSAGSVRLHLDGGSSVRIDGAASAGRLVLPQGRSRSQATRTGPARGHGQGWSIDQHMESLIGEGAGHLDIEVTTGSVVVRHDR